MATLGQAINELLQANGVPGPVRSVEGGPSSLVVTYWELDAQGRKRVVNREPVLSSITLDLQASALPGQPRRYRSISDMYHASETDGDD